MTAPCEQGCLGIYSDGGKAGAFYSIYQKVFEMTLSLAALSILEEIGWSIALFLIAIFAGAIGCLFGCLFGMFFKVFIGPFSYLLAVILGVLFGIEFAKYLVVEFAWYVGIGLYIDSIEELGAFGGFIGVVIIFIFLVVSLFGRE